MAVVQVRADGIVSESPVVRRQIIYIAHQDWLPVFRMVYRPRRDTVISPDRLQGQVRRHADLRLLLRDLVERLRWELGECLMGNGAAFSGCGIRSNRGRGIQ